MDNYHDQRVYEMRFRRQDPLTEGSKQNQAFDNLRSVAQIILLSEQREQDHQRHDQQEHEREMREHAMYESAKRKRAMHESAMRERAMRERAMRERAMRERAMHERVMYERAMHERAMNERAMYESAMRERAMHESAMLRWDRVEDDHQEHGQLDDEGSDEEDLELVRENRTHSTPPTTFSKKKSVACLTSTGSKSKSKSKSKSTRKGFGSKNSVQEEKRVLLGKLLTIENNIKKRTADFNNWKNEMTKERNELQSRVKKLIQISKKTKKKLGFENALNIRFRDIKYKEKNRLEKEDEMY